MNELTMSLMPYLPIIYSYWTGLLIAWSLAIILASYRIIKLVAASGRKVRTSDKRVLSATIMAVISLITLTFLLPSRILPIIDVMLFIDLWYTIFLIFVTQINTTALPIVESMYRDFSKNN